ncbi:MAG: hypothetical protein JHC71_18980, partial [Blastococcus sp.]|nr:hypothetical protein [Blastococcus sp.]
MSAPVMPSGPAVRGPSTGGASDAGGAESATPFASALDGALSESRGQVDDGATGEEQSQDPGSPAAAGVPVDAAAAVVPTPVDLAATLFAFALGTSQTTGPVVDAGAPTGGTAVAGITGTTAAAAVPVPALPLPGS